MQDIDKRTMKASLKLITGLLLIAGILYFVDWRKTVTVLASTDATLALLAVVVLSLNIFISTWKWQILLRSHGLIIPFHEALRAYWVGLFCSNYLPSTVGGDVVRMVMLRRLGRSAEVAASIVLERVTGLVVLLICSAIGLGIRPAYFDIGGAWFVLSSSIAVSMALLLTLTMLSSSLNRWLLSARVTKVSMVQLLRAKLGKLSNAIEHYRADRRAVMFNLLLSILFYIIIMLFQFMLLVAVGADVPFLDVAAIAPIIPLVSLLPVSMNGLGVAEGAFVLFYTQAGVLPEQALAAAALRRVLALLVTLVGGMYWVADRPGRVQG
jgi:glycosyltransferase 2 family protein